MGNTKQYLKFIEEYRTASNAASGSKFDANANVDSKNIATMQNEIPKQDLLSLNRALMTQKITEMYGKEVADKYLSDLKSHGIYKHDETQLYPYCVSITLYPYLFSGLESIGGLSSAPKNLDSFCGSFVNLVFAVASQFAGAVATPEVWTYFDYFARKEWGDDYYKHPNRVVSKNGKRKKTIDSIIGDKFSQIVYSINQPAAARGYQAVFWNDAYFDKYYFAEIFKDFVFPDGSEPKWESVSWLQKKFMRWFNEERRKKILTFPVETVNLLDGEDGDYADEEWADFVAEMWAKGHSFFLYHSPSVDALASCCFDPKQKCLIRNLSGSAVCKPFDEIFKEYGSKSYLDVFHNGDWVKGKITRVQPKKMFTITTENNKTMRVTVDHIFPTYDGDKRTDELTTDDMLMFNTTPLEPKPFDEQDEYLTYDEGFVVGAFLSTGSLLKQISSNKTEMVFYLEGCRKDEVIEKIKQTMSHDGKMRVEGYSESTSPIYVTDAKITRLVKKYVQNKGSADRSLNLDVVLQSNNFKRGILNGYSAAWNCAENKVITLSKQLAEDIECMCSTMGLVTTLTEQHLCVSGEDVDPRKPLTYTLEWYRHYPRVYEGVYARKNNSMFVKIKKIEEYKSDCKYVYCFEMKNQREPYFTLPNGVITHNCRLRNAIQDNVFSYTLGAGGISTGSKGVITIDINRLVQNAVRDNADISDRVREKVKDVHKYLTAWNEIIKDNLNAGLLPVYDAGYISMEKQYLTIGLNGFIEGAEFLGIDISDNEEYYKYAERILKPIYEENRAARTKELMFNTEQVPAENLGVKNARWDREDGYVVPRDCYNSYFFKVEDRDTSILTKIKLHGERITKYLDGGSACHLNLDEHLSKGTYRNLMRLFIKYGCSYVTFNVPNTICNECGNISKHMLNTCPKCGSNNLDYATRIIGYLKKVSRYSLERQKEEGRRYYDGTVK